MSGNKKEPLEFCFVVGVKGSSFPLFPEGNEEVIPIIFFCSVHYLFLIRPVCLSIVSTIRAPTPKSVPTQITDTSPITGNFRILLGSPNHIPLLFPRRFQKGLTAGVPPYSFPSSPTKHLCFPYCPHRCIFVHLLLNHTLSN